MIFILFKFLVTNVITFLLGCNVTYALLLIFSKKIVSFIRNIDKAKMIHSKKTEGSLNSGGYYISTVSEIEMNGDKYLVHIEKSIGKRKCYFVDIYFQNSKENPISEFSFNLNRRVWTIFYVSLIERYLCYKINNYFMKNTDLSYKRSKILKELL